MLETKYFNLAEEVYKRLEDIQKDLNVKHVDAESESERLFQSLRKDLKTHIADYEETIDQLRLDVHILSEASSAPQTSTRTSPYKEPISPPNASITVTPISITVTPVETNKELPMISAREIVPAPPEDNQGLQQVLRILENRLAVVERRTEVRLPRKSTTLRAGVQESAEDLITPQLNSISASLASQNTRISALESSPPPVIDLGPLLIRLTTLENARKRIEPPTRLVSRPSLPFNSLTFPSKRDAPDLSKVILPVSKEATETGAANRGVDAVGREEIDDKLCELESRFEEELALLPKPPDLAPIEAELRTNHLTMLAIREEVDFLSQAVATLRKSEQRRPSHLPGQLHSLPQPAPDKAVGRAYAGDTLLEARLNSLSKDVEKLHSVLEGKVREMEETEQHVERTERLYQSMIERLHADTERKITALEEILDKPADDAEATKNLSALRGVISKLQRDFKSLSTTVSSLQSLPSTPTQDFEPPRQLASVIQRQEGQIRSLEAGLRQLTKEIEVLAPTLKRQIESASASRIAEMEQLKDNVEGILGKVMDGARLNRRDFELVKDLYERVDQKADKAELPTKVDRVELQKAYAALTKKLEVYREEAKKQVEIVQPVREEAAGTFKRLDIGCLSCGQEVKGEIESRNVTPGPVSGLQRYGHGFSRLLPMLNDLITPLHKRGQSEMQQFCSTDRLRRAGSRMQHSSRTPLS